MLFQHISILSHYLMIKSPFPFLRDSKIMLSVNRDGKYTVKVSNNAPDNITVIVSIVKNILELKLKLLSLILMKLLKRV